MGLTGVVDVSIGTDTACRPPALVEVKCWANTDRKLNVMTPEPTAPVIRRDPAVRDQ